MEVCKGYQPFLPLNFNFSFCFQMNWANRQNWIVMCQSAENIFSPVAELQHGLAGGLFLLVNCRVSVSIPSSSLQVTHKYQIPFQISNPVYNVKQKQWEHFEHLGELLFYKVLIRFFTMQIRDCNKLCYINVVTNDGEKFRVLHKKPFGMLSFWKLWVLLLVLTRSRESVFQGR